MRLATLALAALLLSPLVRAQATPAVGDCDTGTASADLEAANVRARLFNIGTFFFRGEGSFYEVPKDSGIASIFAASFWIGGLVNDEIRVAAETYAQGTGYEFWPGPLGDDGAAPTRESCAATDRMWRVTADDVAAYNTSGETTPDLAEWPVDLGAPVVDGDGVPDNYDLAGGDRPAILGGETVWWVMNDRGNEHIGLGRGVLGTSAPGTPLGIEVRVTAFSFPEAYTVDRYGASAAPAARALALNTFYRVELRNGNPVDAIDNLSLGYWVDPDLGNFSDDYVGVDTTRNLAFVYNADDVDDGSTGYGDLPPAIGNVFLNTPLAGHLYYNSDDAVNGGPSGSTETYYFLNSRWRDGRAITYGFDGLNESQPPTQFMFTGTPPEYWSEFDASPADGAQPNSRGDRRHLSYTKRVRLEPGETWTVDYAVVWAQDEAGSALGSLDRLFAETDRVQGLYDTVDLFAPDPRLLTLGVPDEVEPAFPDRLGLGAAPRPHPVVGRSVLDVAVPEGVDAAVEVFDALGRLVATLPLTPGQETVALGALDLAPGSYLARLATGGQVGTRIVQFIVTR